MSSGITYKEQARDLLLDFPHASLTDLEARATIRVENDPYHRKGAIGKIIAALRELAPNRHKFYRRQYIALPKPPFDGGGLR